MSDRPLKLSELREKWDQMHARRHVPTTFLPPGSPHKETCRACGRDWPCPLAAVPDRVWSWKTFTQQRTVQLAGPEGLVFTPLTDREEEVLRARVDAVAATLWWVASWYAQPPDAVEVQTSLDELRENATAVLGLNILDADSLMVCPLCEEVACDEDCPLEPVRRRAVEVLAE